MDAVDDADPTWFPSFACESGEAPCSFTREGLAFLLRKFDAISCSVIVGE